METRLIIQVHQPSTRFIYLERWDVGTSCSGPLNSCPLTNQFGPLVITGYEMPQGGNYLTFGMHGVGLRWGVQSNQFGE